MEPTVVRRPTWAANNLAQQRRRYQGKDGTTSLRRILCHLVL